MDSHKVKRPIVYFFAFLVLPRFLFGWAAMVICISFLYIFMIGHDKNQIVPMWRRLPKKWVNMATSQMICTFLTGWPAHE
jgi:hypothetical protein